MVECTLMDNYAGNTSFTSAMNCTDKHFARFEYVVDIKRARRRYPADAAERDS